MYLKTNNKYASFDSQLAKAEKADCFVRSLAVAADVDYDTAHKVAKEVFGRKDKQGTLNAMITTMFLKAEQAGLDLGKKKVEVRVLGKRDIKNMYKLKGEVVWRQKTLKSFMETHKTGSYIVTVAKHALAVKDGELLDWDKMAFKPTRKVQAAYKIIAPDNKPVQLSLF